MADDDLGLIGLLVLGAFALSNSKAGPGPGPGPTGPAIVQGNFGTVTVAAAAEMAAHHVPKPPGSLILTGFQLGLLTKSAAGQPIPWIYQVVVRLGHNTVLGWRQPQNINAGWPSGHRAKILEGQGTVWQDVLHQAPPDPNQEWDIRLWLFALPSDDQGQPQGDPNLLIEADTDINKGVTDSGQWKGLAYAEHPGAVQTVPGDALTAGSIDTVNVSQECGGCPYGHG